MTQLAQLRIHHSLPKGENLWMSGAAIVRHAGAVGKLIRGSPNGVITPVHSPVDLVAIDRNRWSSSTGNGGRLQPETLVAMARSAHLPHSIGRNTFFQLVKRGNPRAIPRNEPTRNPQRMAHSGGCNLVFAGLAISPKRPLRARSGLWCGRPNCGTS